MITLANLIVEADALARPGTLLVPNGSGTPSAIWHGFRPGQPCVSVRRHGAWLSVVPDRESGGEALLREDPPSPGVPLFAEPYRSLPPPDALFRFGSSVVERYLTANGWDREEPLSANFPDEAAHEYERVWQENCPLYSDSAWAVCGGWHFPWPDGDFFERPGAELAVWTLRDSEPWVEVFEADGVFTVCQRIT